MNGVQALTAGLTSTRDLLNWFVDDLSDDDLTIRVTPTANNIAWQLGHLIVAEPALLACLPGATYPELPDKLKQHNKDAATSQPAGGYLGKTEYLEWFNKVRAATLENVSRMSDADLDTPNTNAMARVAPTLGALLVLVCNHTMMHSGQFTVLRRHLRKPVLF
jgi:uncharacterized damage-inducible protein DinB